MSNFLEEFSKEKEHLKSIAEELKNEGYLTDENLKRIEDTLKNQKIKIAIIGQMKYGKSTFINAFIFNREFLPTSSTPMTAALSEIKYGNKDEYVVTFFTQEEFEEMEKVKDNVFQESIQKAKRLGSQLYRLLGTKKVISPDEFEDYVGADGKYTPIVKMLTIKTPNEILKEAIVVDTPGFNDPVKSRDEIAFNFINEADFVILFLYAGQPFNRTDKQIIVDKLQNAPLGKLIVVINKADVLLEEYGTFDRVKKYVEEKYKEAINEGIVSPALKEILLKAEIIPISGLMALLGKINMSEIEKDENLKWYFEKYKEEFGKITQEKLLEESNIKTLEEVIKNTIKEKKDEILINKIKGEIITPLRVKLDNLSTEKLRIEQELNNLNSTDEEIKEKERIINKFIDEEFDDLTSMSDIYEYLVKIGDECKKEIIEEIDNYEKQTLKAIGTLVDEHGKEKGVEQLELNFRQFNVEIKQKLRNCIIDECLEELKTNVSSKIDEMFAELKKHTLATKFKISTKDFDSLKESILSEQLDSIQEAIENIKLDLPKVDTGWFGDSKESIKKTFYAFSDKYFAGLRTKVNDIYKEFFTLLRYKIGIKSEIRRNLEEKLINPLQDALQKVKQKQYDKEEKIKQLHQKLKEINFNIEKLENKIQEIENSLKKD